jgi:hypothetical protein
MKDKESNVQKGSIDFVGTYKKWQPYGDPDAGNTNSKRPIHEVTHLLVSKYDIFGNERIIWASTPENPNGSPILSTTTGTLFLESRVQPIQKSSLGTSNFVIDTYIFNINGKPIDAGSYYKIPVSFVRSKYNIEPGYSELSMWNDIGRNEKLSYITFFTSYSKEVTTKKPSTQSTVTSGKNTYGGWVFNGLWHRDGSWPIDHKFRSGLLNLNVNNPGASAAWQACDGAVNTGAWIRVNDERVVVESHDFISNSRDTIYRYFHDIHTNIRGQLDIENNTTTALSIDLPVIKFEPDENRELENWEKALVTQRRMALDSIRSIQDKVVIIRLRSNKEDVERGFNEINLFEGQTIDRNDDATRGISRKPGHLLETWILFGVPSANMDEWTDFLLDDNQSGFYSMRWYAEPTDHTRGEFKKDEWYKSVFTRVVTSPSNPNGQMGGIERYTDPLLDRTTGKITNSCREQFLNPKRGIHKVNENNKKTFCDLLYVSEQILKMHRARLVEIKKYVDDIESNNNSTQDRFIRHIETLNFNNKLIRQLKANYKAFSEYIKNPLIMKNPDLVSEDFAFESALFFFERNKLWTICNKGVTDESITQLTKRVNGGINGLKDRIELTKKYYSWLTKKKYLILQKTELKNEKRYFDSDY